MFCMVAHFVQNFVSLKIKEKNLIQNYSQKQVYNKTIWDNKNFRLQKV